MMENSSNDTFASTLRSTRICSSMRAMISAFQTFIVIAFPKRNSVFGLVGLRTQTQNAAFFEKGPKRKPWPRGESRHRKNDRNAFF